MRLSELAVPAQWAQRGLGLVLTIITLMAAQELPRWGGVLFFGASLYLLLLIKLPRLWVLLLPLFCVTVDLAPWTGRFLYNELDVVCWLTIAAALICARYRLPSIAALSAEQRLGLGLLVAYGAVGLMGGTGLGAIVDPPGPSYISPYLDRAYSYKVLKGLLWALLLLPLWRELRDREPQQTLRWMFAGGALAAFGLFTVILWERGTLAAFAGGWAVGWDAGWESGWASFTNLATDYRTIGLFSNMRTGGEALDGTIILLLGICAYGSIYARPYFLAWLCRLSVLALAYVTLVGLTRATYAAFALTLSLLLALELYRYRGVLRMGRIEVVLLAALLPLCFLTSYLQALFGSQNGLVLVIVVQALLLFAVARLRLRWSLRGALPLITLMLGLPLLFALGLTAETMGGRMHRVDRDLDTRLTHWGDVIELGDRAPGYGVLGQGAGAFPALYRQYFPQKVAWIGNATVDPRGAGLKLEGDGDMLFAQRLELEGSELRLQFAARAPRGGRLSVSLCARNILDTGGRDGRCDTQLVELLPRSSFETHTLVLALPLEARSGEAADWPRALHFRTLDAQRPVVISDVRSLSGLAAPIRNGSFKQGMDYWFFSTDFGHLPFHIKNTWLQFWFDHGWLGLLLMLAMVVLVTRRALAAPPGQCFTPMAATAVLGLGALGMFGTPLDEARVSWLFYLLLFAGMLEPSRRAEPLTFRAPLAFRMPR